MWVCRTDRPDSPRDFAGRQARATSCCVTAFQTVHELSLVVVDHTSFNNDIEPKLTGSHDRRHRPRMVEPCLDAHNLGTL
jgi:hypothetical protein